MATTLPPIPALPPIPERVARGAALLDKREPGWADRIDLDRFDGDVLAHLYGDHWRGMAELFELANGQVRDLRAGNGFALDIPERAADPTSARDELTGCWRDEITRRRRPSNGGGR